MSFIDYDNLCVTIADWLARDDLSNAIKDFIWLAEVDIQRSFKFRTQDKIASGFMIEGQQWINAPGDYAEGGQLRFISSPSMPTFEVGSIDAVNHIQNDQPMAMQSMKFRVGFLWADRIYVGPIPGDEEWELFYHAGVQHLGSDVPTNLILQQYPDLLLFASLAASAPYLGNDERMGLWSSLYTGAKEESRMAEWRSRNSAGVLRMRPDVRVT